MRKNRKQETEKCELHGNIFISESLSLSLARVNTVKSSYLFLQCTNLSNAYSIRESLKQLWGCTWTSMCSPIAPKDCGKLLVGTRCNGHALPIQLVLPNQQASISAVPFRMFKVQPHIRSAEIHVRMQIRGGRERLGMPNQYTKCIGNSRFVFTPPTYATPLAFADTFFFYKEMLSLPLYVVLSTATFECNWRS